MFKSNLLTHLGVFVRPQFLDEDLCVRLRSEMQLSAATAATIWTQQNLKTVDENIRRTKRVEVSQSTTSLIAERILRLKQEMEMYFGLRLNACQEPQFLLYKTGDFFQPHQDNSNNPESPANINSRQISVIIFLNESSKDGRDGSFQGGTLTLYGLIDDPRCERLGFPVESAAGLLVAFRSRLFHEVRPVTTGERYTIVSWFY